jgi:hypothetical protein
MTDSRNQPKTYFFNSMIRNIQMIINEFNIPLIVLIMMMKNCDITIKILKIDDVGRVKDLFKNNCSYLYSR